MSAGQFALLRDLSPQDTLGAAYVGFAFSAVMFGINCAQYTTYFRRYIKDVVWLKLVVAFLAFLELFHLILVFHATYHYNITNYANPLVLVTEKAVWSLIAEQTVATIIGTVVKAYFCERLWKFSGGNWFATVPIIILILFQFALGIAFSIMAFGHFAFLEGLSSLTLIATLAFAANAGADASTALLLAYYLKQFRTGFRRPDSLINTLIVYSLNTGAMASFLSILALILYNVRPKELHAVGVYFVLNKFYGISFMYSMNSRQRVGGRGTDQESNAVAITSRSRSPSHSRNRSVPKAAAQMEMMVRPADDSLVDLKPIRRVDST